MDSSSQCRALARALVPGDAGRFFVPALLTPRAASLSDPFSTSAPALVAGLAALYGPGLPDVARKPTAGIWDPRP